MMIATTVEANDKLALGNEEHVNQVKEEWGEEYVGCEEVLLDGEVEDDWFVNDIEGAGSFWSPPDTPDTPDTLVLRNTR